MATINLGAIKFNWKGAYNSGTSYAVDDVVSSGGNSYVCIQAHSNQAVGNATAYWNIMSSAGTNGTDGTDLTSTLTTQGDILYRDGSGLQRLPKGTAGQVLQMNSGATAPEYGTVSSDWVKIASVVNDNLGSATQDFQNAFTEATYQAYQLRLNWTNSSDNVLRMTFLDTSNNELTGSDYKRTGVQSYQKYSDASDNTIGVWNNAGGNAYSDLVGWNQLSGTSDAIQACSIDFELPYPSSSHHKAFSSRAWGYSTTNYMFHAHASHLYVGSGAVTGFRLKASNGNITKIYATLYGMKK